MRTHASAIGAANISDFTSHAYFQKAAKRVSMKCSGKMSANAQVFLGTRKKMLFRRFSLTCTLNLFMQMAKFENYFL